MPAGAGRLVLTLALGAMVVVLVAVALFGEGSRSEQSPADLVPASAHLYLGAKIGPGSEQERAARLFLNQLLEVDLDEGELATRLLDLGESQGRKTPPVESWLGDEVALFRGGGQAGRAGFAYVFEVTDAGRAGSVGRDLLGRVDARHTHRGVDYLTAADGDAAAVVGGHLVFGESGSVIRSAIDAHETGESFADSEAYSGARGGEDDPFAEIVVVGGRTAGELVSAGLVAPAAGRALAELLPSTGVAEVRLLRRRAEIEVMGLRPPRAKTPPIGNLPSDAWLAFSSADLGSLVVGSLENLPRWKAAAAFVRRFSDLDLAQDLIRQIGPGTVHVQGTLLGGGETSDDLAARLTATAKDPARLRRSLIALGRRLGRSDSVVTDLAHNLAIDEPFVELNIGAADPRSLLGLYVDVKESLVNAYFGGTTGSGAALDQTRRFRLARRWLGGPPTTLIDVRRLVDAESATGLGPPAAADRILSRVSFAAGRQDGGTLEVVVGLRR